MGDIRFDDAYWKLASSHDRTAALRHMHDESVIESLAAASRASDPLVANVLATEALNRMRRLRASLAHLGEGVVTLDASGRVVWANPAVERLLGWDRDELMGRDFHDLVLHWSPRHEEGNACGIERALLFGDASREEDGEFVTRDGERICVTCASAPLADEASEHEGIVLAFADCTEERKTRAALELSEERWRSLFEHSPHAIVVIDTRGQLVHANPAARKLTGRRLGGEGAHAMRDLVHPDDLAACLAVMAATLGGAPQRIAFRLRHADGGFVKIDGSSIPIIVKGRTVGLYGLVRDVMGDGP